MALILPNGQRFQQNLVGQGGASGASQSDWQRRGAESMWRRSFPGFAQQGTADQRLELAKYLQQNQQGNPTPFRVGGQRMMRVDPNATVDATLRQGLQQGFGQFSTIDPEKAPWLPLLQQIASGGSRSMRPNIYNAPGRFAGMQQTKNIQELFNKLSGDLGQPDPITFLLALLKGNAGQFRPA